MGQMGQSVMMLSLIIYRDYWYKILILKTVIVNTIIYINMSNVNNNNFVYNYIHFLCVDNMYLNVDTYYFWVDNICPS